MIEIVLDKQKYFPFTFFIEMFTAIEVTYSMAVSFWNQYRNLEDWIKKMGNNDDNKAIIYISRI